MILISNRLELNNVSIIIYDIINSIFYKVAETNKLYFEIKTTIAKGNEKF